MPRYQVWCSGHAALVEKFLKTADRKVSVLDDYGDEKWDAAKANGRGISCISSAF